MNDPLKNPVWEALTSRQIHFNTGSNVLKYFHASVSPFVALRTWNKKDLKELITNIPTGRSFSVMIAKQIELPAEMEIVFTTPLYQMYCPQLKPVKSPKITFRNLQNTDVPQILELTEKTKPGPFYDRTIELGNYIGIFRKHKLVAMAGERLKLNGYTEVSAICTDPDWLGKGYASFLSSTVSEQIISEGNIPFLHVRTDNDRAIDVYKKLGFQICNDVYFAVFKKTEVNIVPGR